MAPVQVVNSNCISSNGRGTLVANGIGLVNTSSIRPRFLGGITIRFCRHIEQAPRRIFLWTILSRSVFPSVLQNSKDTSPSKTSTNCRSRRMSRLRNSSAITTGLALLKGERQLTERPLSSRPLTRTARIVGRTSLRSSSTGLEKTEDGVG